jgi:hypothetical protein
MLLASGMFLKIMNSEANALIPKKPSAYKNDIG